jgi:hypothetical protein
MAGLWVPSCTTEDEIRVVGEEVGETVSVSVQHDAVVFLDNADERREISLVLYSGDVGVVELEELPCCF